MNTPLAPAEQQAQAFNETVSIDFYAYAIGCSLLQNPTTAKVAGDGKLLDVKPHFRSSNTAPYIRPAPTYALEKNWYDVISLMSSTQATFWFAALLGAGQTQAVNISALEIGLSRATAVTYATLIDQWRTQYDAGNRTVTAQWEPQAVVLTGSKPQTYGTVSVSIPYLAVGTASVFIIAVIFLAVLFRQKAELKEVGILEIISLMDRSRLPALMARSEGNEQEDLPTGRRMRAEGIIVKCVYFGRAHCRLYRAYADRSFL